MKTTRFRLIFALAALNTVIPCTRISFAQAPTEIDQRLSKMSDRIERRATKEELQTLQTQVNKIDDRVAKVEQKTSDIATEIRVAEVIGAGLAFIGGIFIQKMIGRMMLEKRD